MAGKEATVYLLDLGKSMGEKRHGRTQTDFDWSMEYVWDKITTTVATGRKTALMGVVGCRTNESDLADVMDAVEGYENIKVFSTPRQYLLGDIRNLQAQLKPSSTNNGDLFSALAVAVHLIDTATQGKTGPLKYDRRLIIVTDGRGDIDTDDLADIARKINDEKAKIEVVLLGVDFDDDEYGYKEENKDPRKAENEKALRSFVELCGGSFGTLAEAVDQLHIPRLKETRPVVSYRGQLTLGDPKTYEATLTIDVERYPCTMIAKPPTASRFVVRSDLGDANNPSTQSSAVITGEDHSMGDLAAVRNQRVYQVDNEEEPGTKKNVEMDELERGYEYGRTAVHISESDASVVKLETVQSLQLIGFVPAEKFDRFLPMSRTNYIVSQRANQQSQLALSSFVHALFEADVYAVARIVAKDNKPPIILLLVPQTDFGRECLIDVELPFEEDMRRYKFPPLDRKITVSGKTITEHRDLPNNDLMQTMSDYVDAMDLSTLGQDEEGNPGEYAKPEDTYAPLVHRINHIVKWRATHPDPTLPIPDPPEILKKYSTPPAELIAQVEQQLDALKKAADVTKVPPKVKGRGKRRREDREKPLSGLDVDELLGNPKRVKIESNNLIPTFKQALAATDDLEAIQEAADIMAKEIRSLITNSVGDSAYGRALEAIRVMRDEIVELEEPEIYNTFIKELKKDLLDGKLNGERREMWWRIRGSRYGLVDQKKSFVSDVTEEEAAEFYKS